MDVGHPHFRLPPEPVGNTHQPVNGEPGQVRFADSLNVGRVDLRHLGAGSDAQATGV
jgi:hypothetical protein